MYVKLGFYKNESVPFVHFVGSVFSETKNIRVWKTFFWRSRKKGNAFEHFNKVKM